MSQRTAKLEVHEAHTVKRGPTFSEGLESWPAGFQVTDIFLVLNTTGDRVLTSKKQKKTAILQGHTNETKPSLRPALQSGGLRLWARGPWA